MLVPANPERVSGEPRATLKPADKTGEPVPSEIVRVDERSPKAERKVARAGLAASSIATFRGHLAERWYGAPSPQLLSGTRFGEKTGFLAKGGNAWYIMKLPGNTWVLPRYQETPPAPRPTRSCTPSEFCPLAVTAGRSLSRMD